MLCEKKMLIFCLLASFQNLAAGGVPRFEVDLDKEPLDRWTEIASYWRDHQLAMLPVIQSSLKTSLGEDYDEWSKIAGEVFDDEANTEMQGVVNTLNDTGVTLNLLQLMNLLYEAGSPTMCSGVLWTMENGTVVHGRNMDYALHFNFTNKTTGETRLLNWNDITYEAVVKKNGTPIWIATMWPGEVAPSTAMRFNGWSFEQNTRALKNNAKDNLAAAKKGGKSFPLRARRVLEKTASFEEAVEEMYNYNYMAPQYFIMSGAGPSEGAILTIDRNGKHPNSTPPIQRLNSSRWHLVQTNDDFGSIPLDPRRPVTNLVLGSWEQADTGPKRMEEFMHTPPLLNPVTVFTTVMVPHTGYYHTFLPGDSVERASDESVLELPADAGSGIRGKIGRASKRRQPKQAAQTLLSKSKSRGAIVIGLEEEDVEATSMMQMSLELLQVSHELIEL